MFKVFPVNKAELRPFRGQITFPLFSDIDDQVPFTWNTDDTAILVNTFKQQLEDNVAMFIKKNIKCGKLIENDEFSDEVFMGLSRKDALNRCLKFVSPEIRRGYEDTFFKDTEVFAEDAGFEKTSQIYAVVLLADEYVYQGHIYMWITGTSCVAFGIRGRPDKMFSVTRDIPVANALIGKIETLAIEQGCEKIIVPNPLPVMKTMLLGKFGFSYERLPVSEIGNAFVGYVPDMRPVVGAAVKQCEPSVKQSEPSVKQSEPSVKQCEPSVKQCFKSVLGGNLSIRYKKRRQKNKKTRRKKT